MVEQELPPAPNRDEVNSDAAPSGLRRVPDDDALVDPLGHWQKVVDGDDGW